MKFRVLGLLIAVVSFCWVAPSHESLADDRPVVVSEMNGPINAAKDEFLRTSLEAARAKDAKLFVLILNTPGGLISSMKEIVEQLLAADLPTVVYVAPSGAGAISAGVFIALSGHKVYMAPGTNIGAAHPVAGGGQNLQGDMREKIENYAVSLIKAIGEKRGRNVEWAEKAVRESVAITSQEALDQGVIDGVVGSLERLLAELEGETIAVNGKPVALTGLTAAPIRRIEMSFRHKVIDFMCDPNVVILLGMAATFGIMIEMYSPGLFFPGIFGGICLILSLVAAQTLPINSGGALLLLAAALLMIIEIFVPSFGVWGVASIVCFVLGGIYFIDTDLVFGAAGLDVDFLQLFVFTLLAFIVIFFTLSRLLHPKRTMRKLGPQAIGKHGTVKSVFGGGEHSYGKILVDGVAFRAHFKNAQPNVGDEVVVVEIEEGERAVVAELASELEP